MKHNNVRQRVDLVLAPDQSSVAGPLRPRGSQYHQKKKQKIKVEATTPHSNTLND